MKGNTELIAICVALREEFRALEPTLERVKPLRLKALRCSSARMAGCEIVLARTGIGEENASRAATALLEGLRPAALVATGFAGGLRPGLVAGDMLIAAEVCAAGDLTEAAGPSGPPAAVWTPPRLLLDAATTVSLPDSKTQVGRLLTVKKVLASAREKAALGSRFNADAVDMESSALASAAASAGIPALAVRAILDEVDFELPFDFGKILRPDGGARPFKTARLLATHPGSIFKLLELRARAQKAGRSLRHFIPRLIRALGGQA